jgi:PASTA domain/Domain of unknown function DUF11
MLRRVLLAACVAAIALAAPASAATDLGQTTTSDLTCGTSGQVAWMTSAPFLAPSNGVLTQMRTASGTPDATLSLKVVRPSSKSVIFTTAPLHIATAGQVVSVDVSVPVQQGDTLGFWLGSDNVGCRVDTSDPLDTGAGAGSPSDTPLGPVAGPFGALAATRLAVAATFEPDADGDGLGDDTQDGCPSDAAISGPCALDAALSATATPASIEVGDVAVLDVGASYAGVGSVRGASVVAALPAGLAPVLVIPSSCSLAAGFSCALGTFTAGSRQAGLVVRGTAPGSYSIPVALSTASTDPNAANNTTAVAIKVVAKVTQRCRVPSVKKRTKSFASALLKAAGCRLGKAKTKKVSKGRSGVVLTQSRKAGTSVPLRTKVNVTVSRRR